MDTQNQFTPPPSQTTPPPPTGSGHPNTGMAILAYLGILLIIPFLTEAKNDPFVKFHIKQGLVLLIIDVVGSFIFWVPIIGWLLWLGVIVLVVMGIMNAAAGKQKELPIIGKFASNFHF
jgi:uncharacterized membrane protein